MNLRLLIEYYEKCKTIKQEEFTYWTYVEKKECGTLCCLWGHAPKFYPNIFKYSKGSVDPIIIEFKNKNILSITSFSETIQLYFEAKNTEDFNETLLLDAIFLGEEYEYGPLDIFLPCLDGDEMKNITLEEVLDRFKNVITILEYIYYGIS